MQHRNQELWRRNLNPDASEIPGAVQDRTEAAAVAMTRFANARTVHGAKCYRVIDGLGLVVARGPKGSSTT